MERKIRIGAVSYLNTKPLLYGLLHGSMQHNIDLVLDYPANLVKKLKNGQIDIGLIPVGALTDLDSYQVVSDYCIGTRGEVGSVAVFSQVPVEEIKTVILDYQSRTSVKLCRLLFARHWKKNVEFIDASGEDYIDQIKDTTAGLIIGDRALQYRNHSRYTLDLGLAWKEMTGLPFVFAVWASIQSIDPVFQEQFNRANFLGTTILETVASMHAFSGYDLRHYYTHNIDYKLDDEMKKGISAYLSMLVD